MPTILTEEDLSLRHLPEVSDYSFSFQIPTSSMPKGDDDLLAGDNNFFEGTDASILATPVPATKPTNQPPSRTINQLTPRPSILRSSPGHQRRGSHVTSSSPNNSYGHTELQASPVNEGAILSKELGRSEVENLFKEELGDGEHQDRGRQEQQQQRPHPFTSTISSTTLDDIPSIHNFAKRSPLESHPEVGYSESDLPIISEPQPQADAAGTKKERQKFGRPKGSQKSPVERSSGRAIPDVGQRSTEITKPLKRPIVAGGIVKSRNHKTSATTVRARSKAEATVPNITPPPTLKKPMKPETTKDGFKIGETQSPDLSLSSFVSGEGVAGRLVLYSEQLMNKKKNAMGFSSSRAQDTEPHCQPEQRKTPSPVLPARTRSRGDDTNDSGLHDREYNRNEPLTLSQISPLKQRAIQPMVGPEGDRVPSFPPPPPGPELAHAPHPSRKRPAAFASPSCHDHQVRKKSRWGSNAISAPESSGLAQTVPSTPTPLSMSNDSQMKSASASLSVLSEAGSSSSGTAGWDIDETEGDKQEVNVENSGPGKTESSTPVTVAETVPMGGSRVGTKSGSTAIPKKRVDDGRPTGVGTRTRFRGASKISSSVNGGRTLRPRSISASASASVHAGVLRASERERRVARVRTRREGREKDKLDKLVEPSSGADHDPGEEGTSNKNDFKRTHLVNSTRPVEFAFASDLRIQARKGDEERMTRSASSLSSGSVGRGASRRQHPNPKYAANDIGGVHRKENVHPVIPQPFHLATEERIMERRKFDEMVRAREREREIIEEQKRREREEEEEKEVVELRKKAVPKANVVPEWYKEAPKKKKDEEMIGSVGW